MNGRAKASGRRRPTRRRDRHILDALTRAAADGSRSAAFILGRLFDEGWGVEQSPRKAFDWYRRAADGGLPEAFYFVATAYSYGEGARRDHAKAFGWYQRAAAAGDLAGAYMHALCVFEGIGVRQNAAAGMKLLRAAARRGSHDAMDYVAAHYLARGRLTLGKRWAERAVEAGDLVAPLRLAEIAKNRSAAKKR